jgi:predicted short-subunit dehydrogenase-like oxidoreductase (DUF2520 family)
MSKAAKPVIAIIGCGNLGWHITKRVSETGRYTPVVYSHRNSPRLRETGKTFKCATYGSLNDIRDDAAFYFLCVPDSSIADVALAIRISDPKSVLLHCAGSVPAEALGNRVHGTGVFYPLQTFSKRDTIAWNEVPVIIDSQDSATLARIRRLASSFTTNVISLPYEQRLKLHLAAVLVSNFPNALYQAASEIVSRTANTKLQFELLLPLIRQTTAKLSGLTPDGAQTGPAKRGDKKTMRLHRELLADSRTLQKIYRQMSRLIAEQQKRPLK